MKVFVLSASLLFSLVCLAQKPGALIDVQHYKFGIALSDSSDNVGGEAVIRFIVLKETNSITLDLVKTNSQQKGMNVTAVLESGQPLGFTHDNKQLRINFPSKLTTGTEKIVEIRYNGVPADGLIITNNKYKRRGFFADHWPDRAQNWLPCVDHPADKATVEFLITAPEHYQAVANGIQVEETSLGNGRKLTHYSETQQLPTKVMVIGVADFAVQLSGMVDCLPVYAWVYPEDKQKGFYDYAQAVDILPFFIKNIAPFPYKKLANVQSKTRYGGLENAGAIFYFENSVNGSRKSESLLAHEIAHQWFGDMATEKEWAHVWLSEGFATYMTNQYMEAAHGKDTATKMLISDRRTTISFSKQKARPVVDSSVTNFMELLNANSYQKGGWILHMLHVQLGDSAFWRSIKTYYSRYAGKNASTEDLQKVFEEISGKNLSVFFRQWLYTPGQPQLDVTWKYDAARKAATITINQKQETVFEFPIEMQIVGGADDGVITKSTQINKKQTTITIPMQQKPERITLDPNVKLLFEGTAVEEK